QPPADALPQPGAAGLRRRHRQRRRHRPRRRAGARPPDGPADAAGPDRPRQPRARDRRRLRADARSRLRAAAAAQPHGRGRPPRPQGGPRAARGSRVVSAGQDVRVERDGEVWTLTIDRPDRGNMLRRETCVELAHALRAFRDERGARVAILTGAGERFFCIGGEHEPFEGYDHSVVLPVVDVYELLDAIPKPVIAAVNGYAVGGGNVLQVMCDLAVASERAVFRQVGPLVGSFDAGFGTAYLEQQIGRRRAK